MSTITFTTQKINNQGNNYNARIIPLEVAEVKDIKRIYFIIHDPKHEEKAKKLESQKTYQLTFDDKWLKVNKSEGGGGRRKGPTAHKAGFAAAAGSEDNKPKNEPKVLVNEDEKEIRVICQSDFDFELQEVQSDDPSNLTFTCSQCNGETPTSEAIEHNGAKYCSPKCRDEAQQKPPQKECPHCKEKFVNLPISGSQGKSYCSDKCKQAAEKTEEPEPDEPTPQQQFDEAEQKRQVQLAREKSELQNLINQANGQDKPEDLKATLDQIEQKSSSQAYQELKSEISGLQQKLNSKLTVNEVQQRETNKLNALLAKNNLKKEDLPAEIQTDLTGLKNTSDLTQIATKSEKISSSINQKGVAKKFDNLFNQVKQVKTENKKKELKTQLEKLIGEADHFVQEYVKSHRSQIETALKSLAVQKKKQQGNPNNNQTGLSTKQKVTIGVGIGGGVIGLTGLVIFLGRRKKRVRHLAK